jgi:hypothetical protein
MRARLAKEEEMKKLVALAAVGALGLASTAALSAPANAAPLPLIQASYWCGPGWHPDPWGRCAPNVSVYGYWGPGPGWGWYGHGYYRGGFRGGRPGWGHGGWHRR